MVGIRSNHERCWPYDGGERGRTGSLDLPRPPFGWFDLKLCVSYVSEHLSDVSGPNATRGEGKKKFAGWLVRKKKMAPCGAIPVSRLSSHDDDA